VSLRGRGTDKTKPVRYTNSRSRVSGKKEGKENGKPKHAGQILTSLG